MGHQRDTRIGAADPCLLLMNCVLLLYLSLFPCTGVLHRYGVEICE
jgi:uncharacterized membrane protein